MTKKATEKGVVKVARYYNHETVCIGDEDYTIRNNVRRRLDITKATISTETLWRLQIHDWVGAPILVQIVGSGSFDHTETSLAPSKRTYSNSLSRERRNPAEWGRVHRRVIICDYEKPHYQASSLVTMLQRWKRTLKVRDMLKFAVFPLAMIGYESLHEHTGISQGNISIGNLMMNGQDCNPSWPAFLINLNPAINEQRDEPLGARTKTGTRVFMPIGGPSRQQTFIQARFRVILLGVLLDLHLL